MKIEQSRSDVQISKNGISRTIYQLTAAGAKSQEYKFRASVAFRGEMPVGQILDRDGMQL
jgi:hypothetical protein